MGIKVKAMERNLAFKKGEAPKWGYVLQADLYGQLDKTKVIEEASVRTGISKAVLNVSWEAIGSVIMAWATEGHSVAIPGLGSMRFGLRSTSVADVNLVSSSLITSRRVIFRPSAEIKKELANTSVSITCYDRNGKIVKRVNSSDSDNIEDPDDDNTPGGDNPGGGTSGGGSSDSGNNQPGGSDSGTTNPGGSDLE